MTETTLIRLRRTVPYRRQVDGERMTLGINDMRPDDDTVVLSATGPHRQGPRQELRVDEVMEVGSERWRVAEIVFGDRGSVLLEQVPPSEATT